MTRFLFLSGALMFSTPALLAAQTSRWNDRPTASWADEAPRVRLSILGQRGVSYGAPVRIQFEVSDNAYVAVVRVDDNGRMNILFPYSRNQRAAARAGVHQVRNPRVSGDYAFAVSDRMGGYVFAIASYTPLDFSTFENRDYDRVGGWSRFTMANRSIARRPDVFIDRFAARVLWSVDTPYDYDVDYYFAMGYPSTLNAYSLCSTLYRGMYSPSIGVTQYDWLDWDLAAYPYRSMCRDYYNGIRCFSGFSSTSYLCNYGTIVAVAGPVGPVPGQPVDSGGTPNEGVIRGGLFPPTPVPIPVEPPDGTLPMERSPARFDQVRPVGNDLDDILSIPPRVTRKMKEADAQRERGGADASATPRSGFDRPGATTRTEKGVADASDAPVRVEPPSREPTKAKGISEPRPERSRSPNFGSTGRTSEPRSASPDRDRSTRPAQPTRAPSNPPSIQGTSTTEKKKPPQD
jgi:hypothetical protein